MADFNVTAWSKKLRGFVMVETVKASCLEAAMDHIRESILKHFGEVQIIATRIEVP